MKETVKNVSASLALVFLGSAATWAGWFAGGGLNGC